MAGKVALCDVAECAARIRALGQPFPRHGASTTRWRTCGWAPSMTSPDEALACALALNLNEREGSERYEARPLTPTDG